MFVVAVVANTHLFALLLLAKPVWSKFKRERPTAVMQFVSQLDFQTIDGVCVVVSESRHKIEAREKTHCKRWQFWWLLHHHCTDMHY